MTFYNQLIIYNSDKDIVFNNKTKFYSYNLGLGKLININNTILNSYQNLHLNALQLKKDYIDEVSKLDKYFSKFIEFEFSVFHLTDLSCKRTEFIKSFVLLAHLQNIKEIIVKNKISNIRLIKTPLHFDSSLSSFYDGCIEKKRINFSLSFVSIIKIASQIRFVIKLLFILILNKFYFSKKNISDLDNKIFFSTYPKNFNKNQHIKYTTFFNNNSYLLSIITDDIHQNLSLNKYFDVVSNLKKNYFPHKYILSDSFINFKDILFFIRYNFLSYSFFSISLEKHFINGINISPLLKYDLNQSFTRLSRTLTLYFSYKRISKLLTNNTDFYYYLFEYSYGRMLSASFSNNDKINKVGFQHGPSGYLKLICYLSKIDTNKSKFQKILLPHKILLEDVVSQNIYTDGNYSNISIMDKVYRLNYLDKILRINTEKDYHLIAAGLHDSFFLYKSLIDKIKSSQDINFILKLHPKANNKKIRDIVLNNKLINLQIADKSINHYFKFVKKVYYGYTSVGLEANLLNIETEIIFSDIKLNESNITKKELFQ